MSQTLMADYRAYYEFRWFAAVGMITFLIAAACGSFIVMAAGMMMWGGFSMLAGSFVPQRAVYDGAPFRAARNPHPQRPPHGRPVWNAESLMIDTRGGEPPMPRRR